MNSFSAIPEATHEIQRFEHGEALTTCRFSPDGRYVFAGAEDLAVHRWDVSTGTTATFEGHESWVRRIDFSVDGNQLLTAGWDGQIGFWETDGENPQPHHMLQAHRGFARWVHASPDGKSIATCGNDLRVRTWKLKNYKMTADMGGHDRHPYAVMYHPDGDHLASEDLMGWIHIWDTHRRRIASKIHADIMTGYDNKFAADMGGARDMEFHPDGSRFACAGISNVVNSFAGQQDPLAILVDWNTKQIECHLEAKDKATGVMWGVSFHPNGFVACGIAKQNGSGSIEFFKVDKESIDSARVEQTTEKANDEQPSSEANDKTDEDSSESKPAAPTLKSYFSVAVDKCVRGMDFSPDGKQIAIACSDGTLRILEMNKKAETDSESDKKSEG